MVLEVPKYSCERAMRITIPAVRAAISYTLSRKHGMKETEIAKRLGIAQAAVSKYLAGKYSKKVGKLMDLVMQRNLEKEAVKAALFGKTGASVESYVERIASNKELVRAVLDS